MKKYFHPNLFFREGTTHGAHVEHRCGPPQSFWWSVAVRFFLVLIWCGFGQFRPCPANENTTYLENEAFANCRFFICSSTRSQEALVKFSAQSELVRWKTLRETTYIRAIHI